MYITLRWAAKCHACGANLPKGTRVRWYSRSKRVYGTTCHGEEKAQAELDRLAASHEDYPCSDLGYEDQCAAACGPGL